MDKESEKYELISSLIDNEIKSKKELDNAIDILLSDDDKYRNFWDDCHLLKDSLDDIDGQIEKFLNNEYKNSRFKFNIDLDYIRNIFKPIAVFAVIYFLCLGIWIFYPKFYNGEKFNYYFEKDKSYNSFIVQSSNDYTNLFYLPNQLLRNISYYISSNDYVLNFEKYLINVLYKFDMVVHSYENEGLEDTNEIITNFFLSNSNDNITREF